MRIGYACQTLALCDTKLRAAQLGRYQRGLVDTAAIYANNLEYSTKSISYSADHGLLTFRLSSDIFPLLDYDPELRKVVPDMKPLRRVIAERAMHVSNHPSQFVVLSSPSEQVTQNSERALDAVAWVMRSLGATGSITIHGGGVYEDRTLTGKRLASNLKRLPRAILKYLAFENDERSWTVPELLEATGGSVPIVFDNLHWAANPRSAPYAEELRGALSSWPSSRIPELHYSEQAPDKPRGAHADYITGQKFLKYLRELHELAEGRELAIVIEAKKKDVAIARALGQLKTRERAEVVRLIPGLAHAPKEWMNARAAA